MGSVPIRSAVINCTSWEENWYSMASRSLAAERAIRSAGRDSPRHQPLWDARQAPASSVVK